MAWTPKNEKWPWRAHLTANEKAVVERADKARDKWVELNRERDGIQSRAMQRAKRAANRDGA